MIHDFKPWVTTPGRSIGQMIRDARDHGVMPEMDTVQAAFDDDGETTVDPFSDPRTDPMDLMNEGLIKERSAMLSAVEPKPEPKPEPTPTPPLTDPVE